MVGEANQVVQRFIRNAQTVGPQDPMTVAAFTANAILGLLLFPLLLVVPITTLVLGLLVHISLGILLLPMSIIWMGF